jgi:hypothetical protein
LTRVVSFARCSRSRFECFVTRILPVAHQHGMFATPASLAVLSAIPGPTRTPSADLGYAARLVLDGRSGQRPAVDDRQIPTNSVP